MPKNMGSSDRVIKILVAIVIAGLYLAGKISGTSAVILLILAVIFILTGFISFCPLYYSFGFSTRKKTAQK
jgi:hypothetical protein